MTVALNGIDLALETLNSVFYYRHIPNIIAVILQMVLIAEVLSFFFFFLILFIVVVSFPSSFQPQLQSENSIPVSHLCLFP